MPDSKKISRITGCTQDLNLGAGNCLDLRRENRFLQETPKMEMINQDTEEFLSTLSDSETNSNGSKSPDLSPRSLTLEQFTDIVLAQEKIDASNSESDIPVTVDEIVDKSSNSSPKQVILPMAIPHNPQSYSQIHPKRTSAGEKLKPVVLTPRQVHIPKMASPPVSISSRLAPKLIPNMILSNSASTTEPKIITSTNRLPLYESIFSLAGSPGTPKYDQNQLTEQLLRSTIPDQRVSDQMRKQLESVIRRNEEILENTDPRKLDLVKRKDKVCPSDNTTSSAPLNLSVRKDLLKSCFPGPKFRENEKKNAKNTFRTGPKDLTTALASLIANTGGDLEITRKVKKVGTSQRRYTYDKPPVVNMTPIYQHRGSDKDTPARGELDKGLGKRKASQLIGNIEEHTKKFKSVIIENVPKNTMKTEPVLPNSMNIKQENSAVENKILTDCKLALQQDLHGNFPLHNAVLLSNVNLVKRFSLVLSALNKSVDLINRFGMTPLHLAVGQNNPVLVGELLHYSASPFSPTSTGDTCYHLAVRQGGGQCLGMLLRRVPDRTEVNLFNDQGQTALHLAVLSGQDALVKMLLAYGAKPDIQDAKSGKTGLFLAIERGNQSMAEQLLCYGGSVSIPSYGGVAPASLCSENRNMMTLVSQSRMGKAQEQLLKDVENNNCC